MRCECVGIAERSARLMSVDRLITSLAISFPTYRGSGIDDQIRRIRQCHLARVPLRLFVYLRSGSGDFSPNPRIMPNGGMLTYASLHLRVWRIQDSISKHGRLRSEDNGVSISLSSA